MNLGFSYVKGNCLRHLPKPVTHVYHTAVIQKIVVTLLFFPIFPTNFIYLQAVLYTIDFIIVGEPDNSVSKLEAGRFVAVENHYITHTFFSSFSKIFTLEDPIGCHLWCIPAE